MPAVRSVTGATGPAGPPGPAGAAGFPQPREFFQPAPSDTWLIVHNLGRLPVVNVIDTAGQQVFGEVHHLDENNLNIVFSHPFSGSVLLS